MRSLAAVAMLLTAVLLAGCSDGGPGGTPGPDTDLDDFGVGKAASGRGVLLGVVVDESITPIAGVRVRTTLGDGTSAEDLSDDLGRFAFADLAPGTYLVEATHAQYAGAATSVEVQADVPDPPVHRVQLLRLFDQEPYVETIQFEGFIACAYSFSLSSTCVNDYTRVTGERCLPTGECYCAGGCLRDYELAKQGGNIREYVSVVAPGWQSIIIEETWEPTSQFGQALGFTVSYFSRPNAGHWFGSTDGESPLRMQLDVGVEHESLQYTTGEPTTIDANGTEELFVFFGAGGGSLAINQAFKAFQTTYYYAVPEAGWSFVAGHPVPF